MAGWFKKLLRDPTVPCVCGARIAAVLTWNDYHYACRACKREITGEEFVRLQKGGRAG